MSEQVEERARAARTDDAARMARTARRTAVAGAVALVVGSVGQLAQTAVTPVLSGPATGAEVVANASAHPGAMRAASWLDLGTPFFVAALVAVAVVAGARTSRTAWWGATIGVVTGLLGVAYLLAWDVLIVEMAQGAIPATAYDAYFGNPVVSTVASVFVLGHLVSLVLLGVALWRSGAVPRWVGALLAAQPVLEIAGNAAGIKPLVLASYVVLVLAFGVCAAALLRDGAGVLRGTVAPARH